MSCFLTFDQYVCPWKFLFVYSDVLAAERFGLQAGENDAK